MFDPETAGRWFDRAWYNARNPDVVQVGIDALAHYLRYGEGEGRFPSPWFDPAWYRVVHQVPWDQCALEHFVTHGMSGEFPPCAALYFVPRLAPWRDTPEPFDRYLSVSVHPERELLPDLELIQSSGLIDATYFLINPVGPFEAELGPALHYVRFGWKSGLRPCIAFDTEWYTETNPVVAYLGVNPLTHYIVEGEAANRRPVPWFDPEWYRSAYDVPSGQLSHYLRHRLSRAVSPNPLFDVEWYVARYGREIPAEVDPFSHFLFSGAMRDIDPSPHFDARAWRHRNMAPLGAEGQSELPVSARNPLVHFLRQGFQ